MKNIVVRHHMLNAKLMGYGGSNYVMLETAIAFAEKGYEVYIDSPFIKSRCDLVEIARFFGVDSGELAGIGIGDPGRVDLVINTSGDVLSGAGDVMYLHYPSFLEYRAYYPSLNGIFNLYGKIYSTMNILLFPLLSRRVKLFIANSWFTASFFYKYLAIYPRIIHPPVNVDDIMNSQPLRIDERDRFILVVSRISPEKRPELSIYVAKLLRDMGFRVVLVGVLSNYNKPYYESLLDLAIRERVDDVVDIYVNIPRHKLVDLYKKSFTYLHITPKEHFGISIVEAMAAGTPTIIPLDSGAWIDIAKSNSNISRAYSDLCEIRHIVREMISNPDTWITLSINGYSRARELDRREFRKKISQTVKQLIQRLD